MESDNSHHDLHDDLHPVWNVDAIVLESQNENKQQIISDLHISCNTLPHTESIQPDALVCNILSSIFILWYI